MPDQSKNRVDEQNRLRHTLAEQWSKLVVAFELEKLAGYQNC
jgi:hypothetical protein